MREFYDHRQFTNLGFGFRMPIMQDGSLRRPVAARKARRATKSAEKRAPSRKATGRKLKFGSPAWRKKYASAIKSGLAKARRARKK